MLRALLCFGKHQFLNAVACIIRQSYSANTCFIELGSDSSEINVRNAREDRCPLSSVCGENTFCEICRHLKCAISSAEAPTSGNGWETDQTQVVVPLQLKKDPNPFGKITLSGVEFDETVPGLSFGRDLIDRLQPLLSILCRSRSKHGVFDESQGTEDRRRLLHVILTSASTELRHRMGLFAPWRQSRQALFLAAVCAEPAEFAADGVGTGLPYTIVRRLPIIDDQSYITIESVPPGVSRLSPQKALVTFHVKLSDRALSSLSSTPSKSDSEKFEPTPTQRDIIRAMDCLLTKDVDVRGTIEHIKRTPLTHMLQSVLAAHRDSASYGSGIVYLLDEVLSVLRCAAVIGCDSLKISPYEFCYHRENNSLVTLVLGHLKQILVTDPLNDPRINQYGRIRFGIESPIFGSPLIYEGQPVGVAVFWNFTNPVRNESDFERFTAVIQQAANVIGILTPVSNTLNLYYSIVDNLLPIFCKDCDGQFTTVGRLFCEDVQKGPRELLGMTDDVAFPTSLAELYRNGDAKVISTCEPYHEIEEHVSRGASECTVAVTKVPIWDINGSVVGVQGTFLDVSTMAKKVAKIDAELKRFIHQARDIIYVHDENGYFVRINPAGSKLFGLQQHEEMRRCIFDLLTPDCQLRIHRSIDALVRLAKWKGTQTKRQDQHARYIEMTVNGSDGTIHCLEVNARAVLQPDSRIWIEGVARDITDRKTTESQLREAQGRFLEIAKRSVFSEIGHYISHEIKGPLNNVVGLCKLRETSNSTLSINQTDLINGIQKEATRGLEIIEGFLKTSRDGSIKLSPLDAKELCFKACKILASEIKENGVHWIPRFKEGESCIIIADELSMLSVLVNLYTNSIHAMRSSEVKELTVTTECQGSVIHIRIEDTGGGFPDQVAKELDNDSFYIASRGKGTGCGLKFAKHLVSLQQGELSITGRSTITIKLRSQ